MGKLVWGLLFGVGMLLTYFYLTQTREHLVDIPPSGATKDAVKNIASAIESVKGIEGTIGAKKKTPEPANSTKKHFTNREDFDPEPAGDAKGTENFSLLDSSPF